MENLFTAISIVIATLTWGVTYLRDRSARRIAHTADILASISTSERLAESSFQVTRLINSGTKVTLTGVDPEVERHVVDMLDYYEFLCDLYANGALSRKTIVEVRGRLMKRTWDVCEPYVRETRVVQNRRVYSGFEEFVSRLPFKDPPLTPPREPSPTERVRP